MAAIARKSTVLAFNVEAAEATVTYPTSGTDGYVRGQDDFDVTPAVESTENAELTGGIGKAKPITTGQAPTFNLSHYIRPSGVSGTAPNYGMLLKAAFGGQRALANERNTAASSTVSLLKLDAGQGAEFARGDAVLIQHASAAYEIRAIYSMSTDDATPGFKFLSAPGTNVNLGKPVTYYPTDTGHQTLTGHAYDGNGGAHEMVSGLRVTEFSFEATAKQLINGSFSLEGVKYYFNPIKLAASDIKLDFWDGTTDFTATITAGDYQTPHDLADAILAAMQVADSVGVYTCTYSDTTGMFTFTKSAGTFTLKWNTGANTANSIGDKIGFSLGADSSGVLTYTSATAQSWASPYTASYDTMDPLAGKDGEILLGDSTDTTTIHPSSIKFTMALSRSASGDLASSTGQGASAITGREVSVEITALLLQHEAKKIYRLLNNSDTRFQYVTGVKSGGNWVKGKNMCVFLPTCVVSEFDTDDADGYVSCTFKLSAFVDSSGNGEVYLSFV